MSDDGRFAFGENWTGFLETVDETSIENAERSLVEMLGVDQFDGMRFLDIGSGSGLSSLAARRLGATVRSFDFDSESVECTRELRRRYHDGDDSWVVEQGSVLDEQFMATLGTFDVVYSWGVLHHTGRLWLALDRAAAVVAPGGFLFVAIYNDQGRVSRVWRVVKRAYVQGGPARRAALVVAGGAVLWAPATVRDLAHGRPFETWRTYRRRRGMSARHDLLDWIGGYPFEVATAGAVFDHVTPHGFTLTKLVTRTGLGCNEYVFRRSA